MKQDHTDWNYSNIFTTLNRANKRSEEMSQYDKYLKANVFVGTDV